MNPFPSEPLYENRKPAIRNRILAGIVTLVLAFVIGGAVAQAQQPIKIPRIGFLTGIDRATGSTRFEEFRRALRELGYIKGENIAIEYRNSEGKFERNPELAAELVRLRVDLIVVAAGLRASGRKGRDPDDSDSYGGPWDRSCRSRFGREPGTSWR